MQMTMNMATGIFKSTTGSVLVALVVFLVAVMVAETSAQLVDATILNKLDLLITVTLPATDLSHAETMTIAARSDTAIQVSTVGMLLDTTLTCEVGGCVYSKPESIQGRGVSSTGTVQVYFTGHCKTGVAGL